MEFHEKLQELRKKKGLTQEELAQILYVSRTAVSKWESGRGYPNIDSLKTIAQFFGISVDSLLSGEELLTIAEEDNKQREGHLYNLVFGLLDLSVVLLLFLPLFGQKNGQEIREVCLLLLEGSKLYLKLAYYGFVAISVVLGMSALFMKNREETSQKQRISNLSLLLSAVGVLLFMISLQPYAATIVFLFLIIKVIMRMKRQ